MSITHHLSDGHIYKTLDGCYYGITDAGSRQWFDHPDEAVDLYEEPMTVVHSPYDSGEVMEWPQ